MPRLDPDDEPQEDKKFKLESDDDYKRAFEYYSPLVTQKELWDKVALNNRMKNSGISARTQQLFNNTFSGGIKKRSTRNKRTKRRRKHCKRRRTSRK